MTPLETALARSKVSVMGKPKLKFFASVLFSLKMSITKEIPTAATNGKNLLINPDFFMGLKPVEREFILMHETYHVVLQHMGRLNGRDMKRWNAAADYVINADLLKMGMVMPEGGLYSARYDGMSADEVYDLLPDDAEPDHEDLIEASSPEEAKEIADAIGKATVRAYNQAQSSTEAYIPSSVSRLVDNLVNPKLPWFQLLRKHLNARNKDDYSFSRPNRRYMPTILPSRHAEKLGEIAVVIDVSGSVSEKQFAHFVNEAYGILMKLKPTKMRLVQFSSGIVADDTLYSEHDFKKVEFAGGGGTHIQPVCDWVQQNKPEIVVVFTDGYFSTPTHNDRANWVWIINDNDNYTAPWGRTIHFDPPD
jgi:predicted metal-dependent peptidase